MKYFLQFDKIQFFLIQMIYFTTSPPHTVENATGHSYITQNKNKQKMVRFVRFYWRLCTENAILSKNILNKKDL